MTTSYVEYLEEQQRTLVKALKMAWQQYAAPPLATSASEPSVHSIMEDLGVMQEFAGVGAHASRRGGAFAFEEDLEKLRRQCEAEADVEAAEGETAAKRSSSQQSSASGSPVTTPALFGDDHKPTVRPSKSQRLASAGITPLKALPTFSQAYGSMMDWPGSKPYSIAAAQQHTLADGWTRSPVSISYTMRTQKDGLEWNASLQMTALDMAIPPDVTGLDMTIAPEVTMDGVSGMEIDNDWATIAPSMLDFTMPMQD